MFFITTFKNAFFLANKCRIHMTTVNYTQHHEAAAGWVIYEKVGHNI